jgi:hypothetical protein
MFIQTMCFKQTGYLPIGDRLNGTLLILSRFQWHKSKKPFRILPLLCFRPVRKPIQAVIAIRSTLLPRGFHAEEQAGGLHEWRREH